MYYSDTPINSVEDDVLGRSNFAHMLAKTFLQMNADETFAVGLFGPWGSGKTSLVNMTLNQICEEQRQYPEEAQMIVIHFEPWAFSDTNQLLMQFFTRLSNELSNKNDKRLAQIGAAIDQYSGAFELAKGIPYVGELVSLLGKRGITSIAKRMQKGADEKDILKKKEYIIELL